MARPRTWTDEDLRVAIADSKTWLEAGARLGLSGPTRAMRERADELSLPTSHFTQMRTVDVRPYSELGREHDAHPFHRLEMWAAKRDICEHRVVAELLALRRLGHGIIELADRANLPVPTVAKIVRGT